MYTRSSLENGSTDLADIFFILRSSLQGQGLYRRNWLENPPEQSEIQMTFIFFLNVSVLRNT